MSIRLMGIALLLAASAAAADSPGLTVKTGESWIFSVEGGQPVQMRKVVGNTKLARGQMRVTLRPLMGTTMIITNNSNYDYAYRATLVLPDGNNGATKSCAVPANGKLAIEHWPRPVAAVHLSDFKRAPAGSLCP